MLPVFYLSEFVGGGGSADGVHTSGPALLLGEALSGDAFPPPALSLVEESWLLVSPKLEKPLLCIWPSFVVAALYLHQIVCALGGCCSLLSAHRFTLGLTVSI